MEIEIIEAIDVPTADPARLGKLDTWITYKVEGARVYSLAIPKEFATEEKIMQSIREAEEGRAKLIGRKFTV